MCHPWIWRTTIRGSYFIFLSKFTYLLPRGLKYILVQMFAKLPKCLWERECYKLKWLLIFLNLFLFTGTYLGDLCPLMMDWFGNLLDVLVYEIRSWSLILGFALFCLWRKNVSIKSLLKKSLLNWQVNWAKNT